jgi:quinol monooxygenase YgiN
MTEFIQFVEFKTPRIAEVRELLQNYEFSDQSTVLSSTLVQDKDSPEWYIAIIRFPSYEAAQANNELPETQEFNRQISALLDEEPKFCNLDVVQERSR